MFIKRKQSLPARPSIPSRDEILQDLRETEEVDVIFKPLLMVLKDQETIGDSTENEKISTLQTTFETLGTSIEEPLDSSTAFEIAKGMLHMCNSLEMGIKDIEEKRSNLLDMKKSLEEDVKNVKEALGEKHRSVATE